MHIIQSETLGETLGERVKSRQESCQESHRESWRESRLGSWRDFSYCYEVSWTQLTLYANFFCVVDYPRIPQYSEKIKESASCPLRHVSNMSKCRNSNMMFEFRKILYLTENKFYWHINERPYCFSAVVNKFYFSIPLRYQYYIWYANKVDK